VSAYGRGFHERVKGSSRRSAQAIVPRVQELVRPASVIDVGCGPGSWLATFQGHGVTDILGLDFGVPHDLLEIPTSKFVATDLRHPFGLSRHFDLAMCLELAEHLPASSATDLVKSLVQLAPVILFSAAIPHQGGTDHQNEQWPDYWTVLFARHGYVPVDALRREFWEDDRVAWWYAQNMLFFVDQTKLANYSALAYYPRSAPSLVHPHNYLSHSDPDRVGLRATLRALPRALARAVRRSTSRP
jgi:SAM-dependent methyltransferase